MNLPKYIATCIVIIIIVFLLVGALLQLSYVREKIVPSFKRFRDGIRITYVDVIIDDTGLANELYEYDPTTTDHKAASEAITRIPVGHVVAVTPESSQKFAGLYMRGELGFVFVDLYPVQGNVSVYAEPVGAPTETCPGDPV